MINDKSGALTSTNDKQAGKQILEPTSLTKAVNKEHAEQQLAMILTGR